MSSGETIVAALSGGVDSATMAALLVEQGHRVIGITMRLYDAAGTSASIGGRCCGPRDIEDARRVCSHLGIPFYVVDFESDFRTHVIDDFVDTYLRGETPNPCVRCNQHLKFSPLLKRARALGASSVATGHYARLDRDGEHIVLRRGVDESKDQSYFLFSMPIEHLGAVRFPLGHLRKDEVREMAERYALPNASKPDSQEICFVPDGDYAGFVEKAALTRGRKLPVVGNVLNAAGEVVGEHRGVHRYTVGQRRGLGNLQTGGEPVYVTKVDLEANVVVVGAQKDAHQRTIRVNDVRWFGGAGTESVSADVQVRYRSRPSPASVRPVGESSVVVEFEGEGVTASPGQAAVFYDGDRILGGGWIARQPSAAPKAVQ